MRASTARALATLIAPFAAPGTAAGQEVDRNVQALHRHAPVYRLDREERAPPASVRKATRLAPGLAALIANEPRGLRVYGRVAPVSPSRTYLQYWTLHLDNPQDRGVLRTGRHAGDWELVQLRLELGRPAAAVYVQHSWAERCSWSRTEQRAGAPVVHVANGSHAAYFTRGVHGRPWPDPDDEARDGGTVLRPPVRVVTARRPAWMTYTGRWGAAKAAPVPGENSSPRSPAFQPDRWDDPAALERAARPCGAGAPGRPWQIAAQLAAGALALAALIAVVRRRRRLTTP